MISLRLVELELSVWPEHEPITTPFIVQVDEEVIGEKIITRFVISRKWSGKFSNVIIICLAYLEVIGVAVFEVTIVLSRLLNE